jgi:hypothetical protein
MDRSDSRTTSTPTGSAATTLVRALQVTAALSVLTVVWQGATAGELLSGHPAALLYHGAGAIILHVFTAAAAVATYLIRRRMQAPLWPTVLAVAVFVCTIIQAAVGDAGVLSLHVPMALMLTLGSAVLLAWSFLWAPDRRPRRS